MVSKFAVMVREVKSMVTMGMAVRVRVKQMLRGIETLIRWLMDGFCLFLLSNDFLCLDLRMAQWSSTLIKQSRVASND